ncbi:MAG: tetratricopeptide repeat protein [Anaerolineae bacterium]|nr:tetratricopeptide repeat protein [Anaerolineae bacterium]
MHRESWVVRTKLTPPFLHKRTLHRSRVTKRLLEALDYRLTTVQAGPGYGKTTALATLAEKGIPLIWYHLGPEDADPLVFLAHLVHGFLFALSDMPDSALALLGRWEEGSSERPWAPVIDLLVNDLARRDDGPWLLILDDIHRLNEAAEPLRILDWFIGRAPPSLHVVLAGRYPPRLPTLVTWRVRNELYEVGQQELAFTPQEICTLFQDRYNLPLTDDEAERLAADTEGWAIALQLVCQGLHNGIVSNVPQALERLATPTEDLLSYLAQEVLEKQPADIRDFLQVTAVLREMTASICDCLRQADDSAYILDYLLENGLFVVNLGSGHARYHHLFHDLLQSQLSPQEATAAHRRAAVCFAGRDEQEEATHHLLAAGALEEAAENLEQLGQRMVQEGRLDTLAGWISAIPPEVLLNHPSLLVYLGDVARLRSRFDEALGWYQQAEERCRSQGDVRGIGQALRGQGRVYLDTVNPSRAEDLLQEALRLADGQDDRETRARLLELMAENLLNLGRPQETEALRAQAHDLREEGPGEAELPVRILLRTGRLDQARRLLEQRAEVEQRQPVLRPRAHRETLLLLSLILAFQGDGEAAYRRAVEGIERGQVLNSPFIIAVGTMRQGHSYLLDGTAKSYENAYRCYQEAIALSERMAVSRLKVEAYWGLCQVHGFRGAIEMAEAAAWQGIEIAEQAGDEWITALIKVSMGAGLALAGQHPAAIEWLTQAATTYRACGDTFGEAVARLWQALVWYKTRNLPRLELAIDNLLRLVREYEYDYLFRRRTLLGPPDPRVLVPLLLYARDHGIRKNDAENLLAQLNLPRVEFHPGYQLRVQTLGPFRIWRGSEETPPQEWRREKARQLFQLLLTYRHSLLDRDQIIERLWPELDPETARRDFKVALSTLFRVLEPERERGAPSAYVLRDGSLYGLRPEADLWLDAEIFEKWAKQGDHLYRKAPSVALEPYRQAFNLFQGEFLQDCLYEEWASEERERLLTRYLRTADRLARILIEEEEWEEVIEICGAILARDDCWEQAYRMTMRAYAALGNRAQALRTYQRCEKRLHDELGIEPSAATAQLYKSILASDRPSL